MIFFLTTRFGRHTVDEYLAWKGVQAREFLKPVTYDQAARAWRRSEPPPGVYLFSDLERLTPAAEAGAAALWRRLREDPDRWLTVNRPGGTLRRLELLRRLYEAGVNRHRAWPLADSPPPDIRFPVFLRVADDHQGARSGLLKDQDEFQRARQALQAKNPGLAGWIACEYAGTSRPDGIHAKYAAFRIGGEIYPRGILFAPRWEVKYPESFGEDLLAEEWEYSRANPHADILRRVFDLAGCDFGRVDYGVDPEGRVSVWEINTNPQLYSLAVASEPTRAAFNDHWNRGFLERLRALGARRPGPPEAPAWGRRFYWDVLRGLAPRPGAGRAERFLRDTGFKVVSRYAP